MLLITMLDSYISGLRDLSINIDELVEKTVLDNSGNILRTIKLRLFNNSIDGDGKSLGTYSPNTVKRKRQKGQRSKNVTLRDTGSWYDSMFVGYEGSSIIIDASDVKTGVLTDIYGEAILKLTEDELNMFIDSKIEPAVTKALNDLGDLNVSI